MARKKVRSTKPAAAGEESRISGQHFLRALAYAVKVAPAVDGKSRLSHLVFHEHRIIASDGKLWLVGVLPEHAALERPFAATKDSCELLMLGLDFARRMAKARNTSFDVELRRKDDELEAVIHYGARHPIYQPLQACEVGHMPAEWEEPVAPDAEPSDVLVFDPGYIKMAVEWYRSWDHDHGEVTFTARGRGGPQRLDMVCEGDLVAVAFVLPSTWPAATLVHNEPLFEKLNPGKKIGQSILDLQLNRDGEPSPEPLDKIEVDGHEINVKGLEDPESLIVYGKCVHDTKRAPDAPCWQCTTDKVKAVRKGMKKKKKAGAGEEEEADGI